MRRLTILLLTALIILPGCALADAALIEAETGLVVADTERAEVDAQADETAQLVGIIVDQNAELAKERDAAREMNERLLDVVEKQGRKPSPWAGIILALVLGIGGAFAYRNRRRVVIMSLPAGQPAGLLQPGQWSVEELAQCAREREIVDV